MDRDQLYDVEPLGEGKRVEVVRIADLKASADPQTALVTYALGSCIAVTLYDPKKHVGGMLHFLLPECVDDGSGRKKSPPAYADTGFILLLEQVLQLGADQKRLAVKAVGGAQMLGQSNTMDIGRTNYEALCRVVQKHGLSLETTDIGGDFSRSAMLDISSGTVTIRAKKKMYQI